MSSNHQVSPVLPKLAERIRRGEVVFFVGAGFSIDSEGMSAKEILWRIWIRLEALCAVVDAMTDNRNQTGAAQGTSTWEQFSDTFLRSNQGNLRLNGGRSEASGVALEVERLATRYYEVNDWVCDAFGRLMEVAASQFIGFADWPWFCHALDDKERELFKHASSLRGGPAGKPSSLPQWIFDQPRELGGKAGTGTAAASPALVGHAVRERHALGKLVLMTTLGFFDASVMAGVCHGLEGGSQSQCRLRDMADVSSMYGGRLRLRHHVLARFAREGFCPTLITTNFDMLLEGALRLAGFEMDPAHDPASGKVGRPDDLPGLGNPLSLQIPYYDVISDPTGFYRRGKAYRTATLLKIHGCAGVMRAIAEQETRRGERMARYLPQVVYTYREIQHWRDDHWTADMLRTVLRTKSMVFAGYSTADPVVHDTFRSVYEEMEQRATEGVGSDHPQTSAPAYFLGYSGDGKSVEFHAQQVLRSASRAVGHPDHQPDHPHYIRFAGNGNDRGMLSLDETLGFLAHEVFRSQQQDALRAEISAVIARLTGNRRPASEVRAVLGGFTDLVKRERLEMGKCHEAVTGRTSPPLARALAWSMGFHTALRREWALGLALGQGQARPGGAVDLERSMRHRLWYFPASERPAWTAWSAVVELA
ncbi:MAG: hypothetical protein RL153_2248, partial [Verrucomicrobiota bacterium]